MISTILSLLLKLLNFIINAILNLILSIFPDFGLAQFFVMFTGFWNLIGNGVNLLYFLLGEPMWIFADIIIILFTLKHIVLPIINLVRKYMLDLL